MDRVQVGMHVDIKRSDGRVHSAIVSEIRPEKSAVLVEWYEGGDTKGKEVFISELVAINPTLVGKPNLSDTLANAMSISKPVKREPLNMNMNSTICGSMEDDNDLLLPIKPKLNEKKRAILGSEKDLTIEPPRDESITKQASVKPERRSLVTPKASAPQLTQRSRVSALNLTTAILPPPIPANAVAPEKKGETVQQIEKLQKQREERRAQQDEIKKKREVERALDPGNPNYQFSVMIRDYQSNIDFRPLKITDSVQDTRISVCVRKRPMNKKEITRKDIEVVTIPKQDHVIIHQPQVRVDLTKYLDNQKFRFDYAFDENADNEMVYRFTAQPLVNSIFEQGFSTCFAYGQTGSGKTHTMGGNMATHETTTKTKQQDWSKGIYALASCDVFRLHRGEYRSLGLTIGCSFFEIYGGKVFDLLKNKNLLRVLEDGKREVQVVGLQEETVTSDQQVLDLIKRGSDMRTAGATSANSNSSRSHAVFQIILRRGNKLWGKFSLIDLAGNERGQDTGSSDRQTRMEGAEINKSLLALKECIRAMGRNSAHVPFRQSKLTMVLRDSFVGENSRTCMIAMISPTMASCEHTLNTLRYANRVKELGCEDGDNASPLRDDELMLANPEAEVDEVLQVATGKNKGELKYEKVIAALTQCEERTINDLYNHQEMLRVEDRKIADFINRVQDPDYEMEPFIKGLIGQLEQELSDRRAVLENANKWLKIAQQESELSNKAKKK
ncbi:unnamed protein product, partial [Mesorhabditis belari]|uniref:Kinesin-like protein n=1 Tax=Mesorhabditis belari TaxID=2138241 RepID=A0AAF3F4A5_9BILA